MVARRVGLLFGLAVALLAAGCVQDDDGPEPPTGGSEDAPAGEGGTLTEREELPDVGAEGAGGASGAATLP